MEYEKITNRDTTHDMFESLKMTHEGNAQVKESKALTLYLFPCPKLIELIRTVEFAGCL